jgi:hypothetical protein
MSAAVPDSRWDADGTVSTELIQRLKRGREAYVGRHDGWTVEITSETVCISHQLDFRPSQVLTSPSLALRRIQRDE